MSEQSALRRKLDHARKDLLDLTARNRLIHLPRSRARGRIVEIVGGRADEVYARLAMDGKWLGLLPAADELPPKVGVAGPAVTPPAESSSTTAETEAEATALGDETAPLTSPSESALQTALPAEVLRKRVLSIFYDARTFEEEQGVNILYLAIGFLRWRDPAVKESGQPTGAARDAPLLLLPVSLERQSAKARFRLRADDEEISTNLSLQAKLRAEFAVELPEVPPREDLVPSEYFAQVAAAIAGQPDWRLFPDDMALGFFSFSKFLMYRDLDPENWAAGARLDEHPAIAALLEGGFRAEPPLCGDDDPVDPLVPVAAATHIVDADSSQTIVIEEIKRGRNLVVQGPPGTGKSQTIANAIATAVLEGKTVLFVAEKMAALDVVKRRLDNIGLGEMCLELHSHKAHKATVLAELGETLRSTGRKRAADQRTVTDLQACRDQVNEYVMELHEPLEPAGISTYRVLGELVRLRSAGVPATEFTLAGAAEWSADEVEERAAALGDLAEHLAEIGPPKHHIWRGVMLDALLPMDAERLTSRLPQAITRISEAIDSGARLAAALRLESPRTLGEMAGLKNLADRIASLPQVDVSGLADPAWRTRREEIARLVEEGSRLEESRRKLSGVVTPAAWSADVSKLRRDLAIHGVSWFRWLNREYRRASAEFAGLLLSQPPRNLAGRLSILDTLVAGQEAIWNLDADEARTELGRRAFGALWRGSESDWRTLTAIADWERQAQAADLPAGFRRSAAAAGERKEIFALADEAARHAQQAAEAMEAIFSALRLDLRMAFGCEEVRDVPLSDARERFAGWPTQTESLSRWTAYEVRASHLSDLGLAELATRIRSGHVGPHTLLNTFWMAYYEELLRAALARHPRLAAFEGASHQRLIDDFRKLDQARILSSRLEVAARHRSRFPKEDSADKELALLTREINKKRRHLPLRQLLEQAGGAIQAVKPVLMMSPISIAQFLEPKGLRFDLLLVDEASQVRPVDALGAIARCGQMVVVGDDRQLPPTRFFDKMLDEAGEVEPDETPATRDLESILDLCAAQGMAQRMLRWHYRSRHHSLIAVSNREFYKNRLYVAPNPETGAVVTGDLGSRAGGNGMGGVPPDAGGTARRPFPTEGGGTARRPLPTEGGGTAQRPFPTERGPGRTAGDSALGLRFHYLPQARFDRGGTATNIEEARAVAHAVMEHARRSPDESLGVGAFSVAQRDAILDELEELRGDDAQAEPFFATDRPEPFFVKNLENIQGDERDVIFISVGYGRDADGKLSMHFGPLSNDGGERRLNVLITRARMRCEVFSSITGDQIDLSRTGAVGARALKSFLDYARMGQLESQRPTDEDSDVFVEQVANAVRRLGYEVRSHVGDSGLRVDLGVIDPGEPSRFLLGIECDGVAYHAARGARDRDRLREQVLADRGWLIHRVWSGDWFRRPEEQLRAVAGAIERAKAQWAQRDGR